MITVIATVRALPGKGPELEADFRAWAEVVRAKEPGCLMYTLNRGEDPELYYAVEQYKDQAAVQQHMANFQSRPAGPQLAAGPPEILVLEQVA